MMYHFFGVIATDNLHLPGGFLERCLEELKRLNLTMTLRFTTSVSIKGTTIVSNDAKSQPDFSGQF